MDARPALVPGARVADVGCGPGAMLVTLAEHVVGPTGHVIGVDTEPGAVTAARAALAAARSSGRGWRRVTVRQGWAERTGLASQGPSTRSCCATCSPTTAAPSSASWTTWRRWSAPAATSTSWTST